MAGCRSSGDCPQIAVDVSGVSTFAPQGCIAGQCQPGKCTDTQGCTFGQKCASSTCVSACADAPYCRSCDPRDFFPCGDSKNYCLEDPRNSSGCSRPTATCRFFCGVDCSSGQACPAGYACYDIVVVVKNLECTCNTQCANGTGLCACNEGATSGFCRCRNDQDCGLFFKCSNGYCILGKNCAPSKGFYCDAPGPACP